MRIMLSTVHTLVIIFCFACANTEVAPSSRPGVSYDGLEKTQIDAPGELFLRQGHGIGGYDSVIIAPAFVSYTRQSTKLTTELENVYLAALEQSVVDVAEAAAVPISNAPDNCALKIGIGFINVDLPRRPDPNILGEMTLILIYQDSMSGETLLRYSEDEVIQREAEGSSREKQVSDSFDQMIAEVDIITALRKATVVPSPPRQGCEGRLIEAGRTKSAN